MKTQRESSPLVWLIIIFAAAVVMPRVIRTPQWLLESAAPSGVEQFGDAVALLIIGTALLAAVIATPIAGAYFIWWIVRWTNRRDDPRYANRPSTPADAGQIAPALGRVDQDLMGNTTRSETRVPAILPSAYSRGTARSPRRAIELAFGNLCLLAGLLGLLVEAMQLWIGVMTADAAWRLATAITVLIAGCYLVFLAPRQFKETGSKRLIWAVAFFAGVVVIETRLCPRLGLKVPDDLAFDFLPWASAALGERIAEFLARRRLRI